MHAPRQRTLRNWLLAVAFLWLASGVWLAVQTGGSRGAVELRNSLLADLGSDADFGWQPAQTPAGFRLESLTPPPVFDAVAREARDRADDGQTLSLALALAAHLQDPQGERGERGAPIMAATQDTYTEIRASGAGYCADYTQVYNGLAHAAGIAVREWGIGFGGFGAGHAVSEVYAPEWNKWVMIDSFYSFYPVDDTTGAPLSVLEFRERLMGDAPDVRVVPIVDDAYRFKSDQRLFDYFRRGQSHYFLWWGNDVLSYDSSLPVRLFSNVSRSLEQLVAIASGVHPRMRVVPDVESGPELENLIQRRNRFAVSGAVFALLTVVMLALMLQAARLRSRRRGEQ